MFNAIYKGIDDKAFVAIFPFNTKKLRTDKRSNRHKKESFKQELEITYSIQLCDFHIGHVIPAFLTDGSYFHKLVFENREKLKMFFSQTAWANNGDGKNKKNKNKNSQQKFEMRIREYVMKNKNKDKKAIFIAILIYQKGETKPIGINLQFNSDSEKFNVFIPNVQL